MVGSSDAIVRLRAMVSRVAASDCTVLIQGETGTGKELVAQLIHEESRRCAQQFLAVNCATIPSHIAEGLLFGHERGAFTGAERGAAGYFEAAHDGTIFLDEIGDAGHELQAKLLRALEERTFRRLGGQNDLPVRARILTASHVALDRAVHSASFRADLYYRLNVVRITVPSLRERLVDLPALVEFFAQGLPRRLTFTPAAMALLSEHSWPGNIRELRNVIVRVSVLSDVDVVTQAVLADFLERPETSVVSPEAAVREVQDRRNWATELLGFPNDIGNKLHHMERELIVAAMRRCGSNKSAAARLLGLNRKALERKLCKFGVSQGATVLQQKRDALK